MEALRRGRVEERSRARARSQGGEGKTKREAKEEAARKAAEKEARAKVPPSEMFKTFSEYEGLYSKYDDDGVPTHDAAGEALAKSAAKKLLKSRQQQEKAHETYLAKAGMEKLAV